MATKKPWGDPQVGDHVYVPARAGKVMAGYRKVTKVTDTVVTYEDGRMYSQYDVKLQLWVPVLYTSCARSTWATWCSKNAQEYWRAGELAWKREAA